MISDDLGATWQASRTENSYVDGVLSPGEIVVTELVTNAVVHGSGRSSVRVSEESSIITVAVRDAGTRDVGPTGGGEADPLAVHGRGLRLVDAFASRWGSDLSATGLTVWFVLDG